MYMAIFNLTLLIVGGNLIGYHTNAYIGIGACLLAIYSRPDC